MIEQRYESSAISKKFLKGRETFHCVLRYKMSEIFPVMTEDFVEDVPASEVGVVSGYVMFPLGKATISQAEQKSAVMTQAAKALEKVMADKNAKITNMFVYVSNSPEGAERLNRNLGVQRFNAAKAFFEKDLKLAGTPMVKDPSFVVSQTETENWEGLYLLLENSTIANRQQMVRELKAANAEKRSAILEAYIAKVDMPDIHLAYAQLMNNDNRAALETFRKIKLNNAMEYYMMAVAAARTKDMKDMKDMVYALEKAVKLQPDLKEWAATDIAFYPYKGESVFMRIVK